MLHPIVRCSERPVLIWRKRQRLICRITGYFKTSYVEVYRVTTEIRQPGSGISKHLMLKFILTIRRTICSHIPISKHLMLKFIDADNKIAVHCKTFQNILCWSLSDCKTGQENQNKISKHLMLKFITERIEKWAKA